MPPALEMEVVRLYVIFGFLPLDFCYFCDIFLPGRLRVNLWEFSPFMGSLAEARLALFLGRVAAGYEGFRLTTIMNGKVILRRRNFGTKSWGKRW